MVTDVTCDSILIAITRSLCRRLVAFLLLIAVTPVFAATATGYIPFQCMMTGDSRLHLTHIDGHPLTHELYLRVPEERFWDYFHEWYEVQGETCLPSGECEPTIHTKVQILHVSRNHFLLFHRGWITSISGNFEIELKDGGKFAGSFKAKFRIPSKRGLCE